MSANIYSSPDASLANDIDEVVPLTWKQIFFSFSGRIPRSTYWFSILGLTLAVFAVMLPFALMGLGKELMLAVYAVVYIGIIWCSIALQVKRWHDRDKSGWWVLISLVPVIGPLWALIELGFLAGTEGTNRFGAPAK